MAQGLNNCQFIGNLGADPETRYTPSGVAVCNIRIGCSESWKDKNTGEKQERTEWVRIVAFNRLAEIMGEYLKKGSQVYIEGRMQTDKYQDDQGNDRYATKIIARDMQMLGGRGGSDQGDRQGPPKSQPQTPQGGGEDFSDIPFAPLDWRY